MDSRELSIQVRFTKPRLFTTESILKDTSNANEAMEAWIGQVPCQPFETDMALKSHEYHGASVCGYGNY
jgi:hypothetical protein